MPKTEYTMHYLKLLRAAETRGKLEIENMKLDMVPIEVCELHALTILSMKHNQIKSLPRSLTDLSKLMTLDVSHNQVAQFTCFTSTKERSALISRFKLTLLVKKVQTANADFLKKKNRSKRSRCFLLNSTAFADLMSPTI